MAGVPRCPWAGGRDGGSYRVGVRVIFVTADSATVGVTKTCDNASSGLNARYLQSASYAVRRAQTAWIATLLALVET
jgi:hypothetical protein